MKGDSIEAISEPPTEKSFHRRVAWRPLNRTKKRSAKSWVGTFCGVCPWRYPRDEGQTVGRKNILLPRMFLPEKMPKVSNTVTIPRNRKSKTC